MEGTLHVIEVEDTKFKGFFKKLCCFAKRCRRKKSNDAVYRHIEYRPVIDAVVLSGYKLPNLPPGKVLSTAPDAGWEWPQHVPIFEIVRKYKRSQLTRKRTPQVLGSLSRFPSDPCLAESPSKAQSKPSLTFSVFYDHQVRTLTVHLQSGNNLSSSGSKLTKAHLYVTVSLLPLKNEIAKTRPMKGNVPDPTFDEKFQFTGFAHNDVLQQTLVLRVYFGSHYALLRNFVGAIELPLRQSHLYGYRMTKELTEQVDDFMVYSVGDFQVSLTYWPNKDLLEGVILRVSNLQEKFYTGVLPDPYVSVVLYYENNKQAKWTSTVQHHSLTTTFNESFSFNIAKMEVHQISLHFNIKDHQMFGPNSFIGSVQIGPQVMDEQGQRHWVEMIHSPYQAVSRWHPIFSEEGRRKIAMIKT